MCMRAGLSEAVSGRRLLGTLCRLCIKGDIQGPLHRVFNCETCMEGSFLFHLVAFALSV